MNWITAGHDVQYSFTVVDNVIHIAFQGTESISDWAHNFMAWVLPYKDMPVKWRAHAGFVTLYKSVRKEIMDKVRFAIKAGAIRVVLHGKSQGAALVTLCFEDIRFTYPNIPLTGTALASPRVLWLPPKVARKRFRGLILRNHRRDIVTHLPFWIWGYRHINPIWFGECGLWSAEFHKDKYYYTEDEGCP